MEAVRGKAEVEASVDLDKGSTTGVILEAKVITETKRKEILKKDLNKIKVIVETIGVAAVAVVAVIEEVVVGKVEVGASIKLPMVRTRN